MNESQRLGNAENYQPPNAVTSRDRVSWRDTFSVWPAVNAKVELMPWHWRFRWYRDGIEPYYILDLGPLTLTFSANKGLFPLERVPDAATYSWEFCRSCGGGGWIGARIDHEHPSCGHRCILCYPPPGYDRTYAKEVSRG